MNLPIPSILWGVFLGLITLGIWWIATFTYARRYDRKFVETDLRLTYKRFKELYPFSKITYPEYKKLQAQKAFRRSVGSEKIKRMVR